MSEPSQKNSVLAETSAESRYELAGRLLGDMKKAFRRRPSLSQICIELIGLSFAVIGVVLSLYGNVFVAREEGDWTVLFGPEEVQEIKMSELMSSKSVQGPPSERKPAEVVWVFAIDVSGSLLTEAITQDDWALFDARLVSDRLAKHPACASDRKNTRFHLARAQACCYIHNVVGDRVELWKFGASPQHLAGVNIKKEGKRRDNWESLQPIRQQLLDSVNLPDVRSPDYRTTNFEKLLDSFYSTYIFNGDNNADYKGAELHFVIVSDFVHDMGAKGVASYVASMEKIADRFSDIGDANNAMFHLAAVTAGSREVNSVIRVVEESAGWYQYRFDTFDRPPSSPMPDFFYSFSKAAKPLIFYHVAGTSEAQEIRLKWDEDMPSEESAKLIIGLMTDVYGASDQDLAVYVSEGRPDRNCRMLQSDTFGEGEEGEPPLQNAVLRPKGRQAFDVKRPNDHLCVRPLAVEKERVYNYKLTLSHAGNGAEKKVHIVDIKFKQYIPPYAARTLLLFSCLALVCGSYLLFRVAATLSEHWRERRRNSVTKAGAGVRQA